MRAKVDHSQGVRSVTNGSYREADRSRRFDSAGSNSWNECLVIKLRHNDHCHMQCERKYLHQPNGPKIDTAGYRVYFLVSRRPSPAFVGVAAVVASVVAAVNPTRPRLVCPP